MTTPSINQGQIAIDPVSGILYYKTRSDELVQTSLNLLQESNALITTEDSLEVGGDFVVSGDFTVSGNTVILNTETLLIEDNIIVLNSNVTGTPTVNAGIEINRGNVANVQIIWNETLDKWQFTNDGVNYATINESVSTANAWTTSRIITLSGDLTGSVSVDGSSNVTLTAAVVNDSHNHTASTLTFGLDDVSDVTLSEVADGDFLRYNGNVWINDPVNLATDTIGSYVESLVAGTGITLTNNSGEGSTPTIAVTSNTYDAYGAASSVANNATAALANHESDTTNIHGIADTSILVTTTGIQTLTNKTITSPSGLVKSDVGLGNVDNTSDANKPISTAAQTALDLKAPIDSPTFTGTVTLPNNTVALGTQTTGNYVQNIAAGEGIEISNSGGEGATPTISIQDESITSAKLSPTFEYVDRIYSGNNIVLLDDIGLGVVSSNISVSATPSFESVTTTSLFIDTIEIDPSGADSNVQVLRFDTATNKFIPGLASTVAALSDLTDVSNTSPTIGDFLYWNGTVWIPSVPATGMPIVSDTAPVAPSAGQLWFDSSSARTFIYYVDSGASPNSQWVEIGSAAPPVTTVTKYAQTIGDGTANTYVVTHNLNTKDIVVDVYDTSTDESVDVRIRRSSADSIEVDFSAPILLNSYRVVVIG